MELFRGLVAFVGASFIYLLIRIFGRTIEAEKAPWLEGPVGGDYIGDKPYEECAAAEGLHVERDAKNGGLVPDFDVLASPTFDPGKVHARIRDFYENTSAYRMDLWARTPFPANIALWLLVTTISRKVNQLNFPLRFMETAKGMDSEIVLLRQADGEIRYTGWYRRQLDSGRTIYTGFYMTEPVPLVNGSCVKVVFPMPNGNATVILKPRLSQDGDFELSSEGTAFGDVGFYRIQRRPDGRLLVWYIKSLKENFRVYVDSAGVLRCDHDVRFLGLPVLQLHYRIDRAA